MHISVDIIYLLYRTKNKIKTKINSDCTVCSLYSLRFNMTMVQGTKDFASPRGRKYAHLIWEISDDHRSYQDQLDGRYGYKVERLPPPLSIR